jgi:hypothetical protein
MQCDILKNNALILVQWYIYIYIYVHVADVSLYLTMYIMSFSRCFHPTARGSIPGEGETLHSFLTGPEVRPVSCTMGVMHLPGVNRPGRVADHTTRF